jgi:hypothetical protein
MKFYKGMVVASSLLTSFLIGMYSGGISLGNKLIIEGEKRMEQERNSQNTKKYPN